MVEHQTLSELAYNLAALPNDFISDDDLNTALEQAGISAKDDREKERLRRLIDAARPLRQEDRLASFGHHAERAREQCGDGASHDELIAMAYHLSEQDRATRRWQ
jgi:hypothetical protein